MIMIIMVMEEDGGDVYNDDDGSDYDVYKDIDKNGDKHLQTMMTKKITRC